MDLHTLQTTLTETGIRDIRYFDDIGSTNDEALQWITAGAEEGCLVVADTQTKGRGRLGRKWVTQPGSALAFSLILKPAPEEISRFGLFSPLGAVAVSQALETSLGLKSEIKWPNDVLLQGRKVCGILVEAAWSGDRLEGLVIGIGLNVARVSVPPDAQVLFPAISVEHALGKPVDREALLRSILLALLEWRARLDSPAFFEAWQSRLAFLDQTVMLNPDAEKSKGAGAISGKLKGIDSSGNLLLELPSGEVRSVQVGDVHLRPVQADQG